MKYKDTSEIQSAIEYAWAYNIADFAEHISRGGWVAYPWLKYLLGEVQTELFGPRPRLIVNAPPRHGKSESLSFWLCVWYLFWYPENKIILASYGQGLATNWARRVRDTIESNPILSARIQIVGSQKAKDNWVTKSGGGMQACGIDGGVTGYGGHLLIIDDPHKDVHEAHSPVIRAKVIDWWDATFKSRLEPMRGMGGVVLVQTRWHPDDLTGYLLKTDHDNAWRHIRLPALADRDDDPLGRHTDEPLCPERYTKVELEETRKARPDIFVGLYQQLPAHLKGEIIQREWVQYYDKLPGEPENVVISWDLTFKEHGTSFVAGQVWWKKGANFYLLNQEYGKWDFPTTLNKVKLLYNDCIERYGSVLETLIEDKANGPATISSIKNTIPGVIPVQVTKSKTERTHNVAPLFEAGNVFFPSSSISSWINGMVEEVVNFPNVTNDDQLDACTQMLNRHKSTQTGSFTLDSDSLIAPSPWDMTSLVNNY